MNLPQGQRLKDGERRMIKVELRLQPEGKPQEVDGLLWGGKEPVQFQFDWGVPDELRHQNGTYVLHRSGTKCFPKSNPVEIIKIDRTSIGTADDLIGDHFDLLTATVLNRGNMLGDNLSLREVDKAKYRVIYANNEDLYLSGLERLATAVEPEDVGDSHIIKRGTRFTLLDDYAVLRDENLGVEYHFKYDSVSRTALRIFCENTDPRQRRTADQLRNEIDQASSAFSESPRKWFKNGISSNPPNMDFNDSLTGLIKNDSGLWWMDLDDDSSKG